MVMKKYMKSNAMIIVGDSDISKRFPPGFTYILGGITYTVRENVTKDANTQMRRVVLSDGGTEIMTIETIVKDLKDKSSQVLAEGAWPEEKTEEVKIEEKAEEVKTKKTEDKNGK